MPLYRLDASIRVGGSHSRAIADIVEPGWRAGTAREGWDHATGWVRRILGDVRQPDLRVVQAEFTLISVNPALDRFADLSRSRRAAPDRQAAVRGREFAAATIDRFRAA